jgi:D-3-phosphoglycerate dehydrogenase
MKIAVGASTFGTAGTQAKELLESRGYEVVKNPYGRKLTVPETIEHLQGAVGLLAGLEILGEEVFSACPKLRAVARIGVGTDNVDVKASKRFNVKTSNTPDAPAKAVAEMTAAALLSITRGVVPSNADMHNRVWKKSLGFSLQGAKILLIGYGRIAKALEQLLKPFGAEILINDPFFDGSLTLGEALPQADVISLHASGKARIIGAEELAQVKNGAILLNSARGALTDENAVADALKSGRLGWYWGDVFGEEPYSGALCDLPNAVLTPHIASNTGLCRLNMELEASRNILRDLA